MANNLITELRGEQCLNVGNHFCDVQVLPHLVFEHLHVVSYNYYMSLSSSQINIIGIDMTLLSVFIMFVDLKIGIHHVKVTEKKRSQNKTEQVFQSIENLLHQCDLNSRLSRRVRTCIEYTKVECESVICSASIQILDMCPWRNERFTSSEKYFRPNPTC